MRSWTRCVMVWAAPAVLAGVIGLRLLYRAQSPPAPPSREDVLMSPAPPSAARLESEYRMAQEVAAGRLSLLEAAAGFKALDANPPPGWVFAEREPGLSDEEYYCRRVIGFVGGALPPEQADPAIPRLQADLEARRRDGTLHLPDAPAAFLPPAPGLRTPASKTSNGG